jgi:hypothetical protein
VEPKRLTLEEIEAIKARGYELSPGKIDALCATAKAALKERDEAGSLLAVMHRDGGHHTQEVGFQQSCLDAIEMRNRLVEERDEAVEAVVEVLSITPRDKSEEAELICQDARALLARIRKEPTDDQ